jgi:hypothetical protein
MAFGFEPNAGVPCKSCPADLPPSKHASAAQLGRRFVSGGDGLGFDDVLRHDLAIVFVELFLVPEWNFIAEGKLWRR